MPNLDNIFNKFFTIPDYVRNHEVVTILEDRDPSVMDPFNPPMQTWTNLNGKSIEEAKELVLKKLSSLKIGSQKINYKRKLKNKPT